MASIKSIQTSLLEWKEAAQFNAKGFASLKTSISGIRVVLSQASGAMWATIGKGKVKFASPEGLEYYKGKLTGVGDLLSDPALLRLVKALAAINPPKQAKQSSAKPGLQC